MLLRLHGSTERNDIGRPVPLQPVCSFFKLYKMWMMIKWPCAGRKDVFELDLYYEKAHFQKKKEILKYSSNIQI